MGDHSNLFYLIVGRNLSRRNKHQPRAFLLVLMIAFAAVHPHAIRADGREWCRTVSPRATASVEASGVCPTRGVCDEPAVRDVAIPDESAPIVTIRLKFNVFREDDGTNPTATAEQVDAQVVQLQADFLPRRIQFTTVVEFINDSESRNFIDSHEVDMKIAHADQPDLQLNIYVVDAVFASFGSGTFPWNSPLSNFGGVIIDKDLFGATRHILSHETGHTLGLWHVHHGVSEVADCSVCYELADGSNGDTAGDFCSDTPSTPTNQSCLPPDADDCEGVAFPLIAPLNIMGRAEACLTQFSAQQAGRMHCWIDGVLSGWVEGPIEPPNPNVPTISAWGMIVLSLALSAAASVMLIRRRDRSNAF